MQHLLLKGERDNALALALCGIDMGLYENIFFLVSWRMGYSQGKTLVPTIVTDGVLEWRNIHHTVELVSRNVFPKPLFVFRGPSVKVRPFSFINRSHCIKFKSEFG